MKRKSSASTTLTPKERKTLSKILQKARAAKAAKAAQVAAQNPRTNSASKVTFDIESGAINV